jgi:hypothetical protein
MLATLLKLQTAWSFTRQSVTHVVTNLLPMS